jgi:hypothetical protein
MRQQLNTDIAELLKEFLNKQLQENLPYFYEGKVEDNNDPDKLGRCKVRVYGIYTSTIKTDNLPWALPDFSFVGGKAGSFVVPPNGTLVNVYFERGDVYLPHYTTKVIDKANLPSERNTDYPDTMVLIKTDEGDVLTMNRKTKKLIFIHNSGTKLEIDKSGNVDVLVKGNCNTDINGNSDTAVDGTIKIEQTVSKAAIEVDMMGNINITQSMLGSVNIGGMKAQLYCPDLQVCPITGSPLSILTKIPGFSVKVP